MAGPKRAFISYTRTDQDLIERLERYFDDLGWDAWLDRELSGGERWWDSILQNIRQCDVFVFAMSQESLRSTACNRELEYAVALARPIIPVVVGDAVPDALLPPVLAETQRVDVRSDDAQSALALGRALLQIPPAPPLPDPLPTAPSVPLSYLTDLKSRVEQAHLPSEDQWRLLTELEERLAQPSEHAAALVLMESFSRRPDLMQGVAMAAKRVVEGDRGGMPPPPPEGVAASLTPGEPPRPERRRRVILAGAALLVVAGIVGALAVLDGSDGADGADGAEPSDFCDRARSADVANDRAQAFLITPEADPTQADHLYSVAQSEMTAVANAAPAEIEPATRAVKSAFEEDSRILEAHNWVLAEAPEFFDRITDEQLRSYDREFGDYLDEQCGIDWDEVAVFTNVSTAAEGLGVLYSAGSFGVSVTSAEAHCFADSLGDAIDGDRVLALYGQELNVTNDEAVLISAAIDACIETSKLAPGLGAMIFGENPGIDEDQRTCLARGILERITLEVWFELGLASVPASPELRQQLADIAEGCEVDLSLVLPS